jgi:DNA polymerase III delta subunit
MIKVLEGNDFLVQEYINDYIAVKFKGVIESQKRYSIVRNPKSVADITNVSPFGCGQTLFLWSWNEYKKLEKFNPYVIPKGTDIFIWGDKIDKRLLIVKALQNYSAEFKVFKDLYPNQVESWILNRKKKINLKIQPDAVQLLAVYYGSNLVELANCMSRLKELNVIITKDIVNKIAVNVNEFTIFELQDEILLKKFIKSLYIVRQMLKNGEQGMGITRYFINFFEKLIAIKTEDEELIKSFKLHPFILKKLRDVNVNIDYCLRAIGHLGWAEKSITSGVDVDYVMDRTILNLCKG